MQHSTAKWRRRPFCCESSQRLFENYYARQAGGNDIPIFTGQQNQKGYGLRAILKSFFRRFILPIFVEGPVRKTLATGALQTATEVGQDMLQGEKFKQALKRRVPAAIKRTALDLARQSGSGIRRKRLRRSNTSKTLKKPRRRRRQRNGKKGPVKFATYSVKDGFCS